MSVVSEPLTEEARRDEVERGMDLRIAKAEESAREWMTLANRWMFLFFVAVALTLFLVWLLSIMPARGAPALKANLRPGVVYTVKNASAPYYLIENPTDDMVPVQFLVLAGNEGTLEEGDQFMVRKHDWKIVLIVK